jgi:pyruvate-ferredoxin/flavodoxin oxidoreductase
MAQAIAAGLMALADGGNGSALLAAAASAPAEAAAAVANGMPAAANLPWAYEPVWVETPECTACDECIALAPKTFQYDASGKAVVVDPRGSAYRDLVKAAEKCTAGCLHPGTPWRADEKDAAKLMQRAERFQ